MDFFHEIFYNNKEFTEDRKSDLMKTRKKRIFLLPILSFLLLLSGCGKPSDDSISTEQTLAYQDKGVIYEHLKTPITTIDPAYVNNEGEIMISKLIFQGLVKETSRGEVVPSLARDWEVSPDKLTYTFHLNKRILFHNGKEIKASDFKFSWERVLRLNAPAAYLFANIEGVGDVLSGNQTVASGITAVDDYTLQVKLLRPQNNFVNLLTHPAGAVLDRYEVVEQGLDFAKPGTLSKPALIPSGSGPFQLIEWIDKRNLTLGKSDTYAGEKPSVWRIEFPFYEKTEDAVIDFLSGKVHLLQDVIPADLVRLAGENDGVPLVEKPVLKFRYVGINAQIKPFDNKYVRDAVMYSLNGPEIFKAARGKSGEVLTGYVADYWYRQSVQEKAYYSYQQEAGMSMLALGGYPGGINLPEITLYCGSSGEDQIVGKQMAENLTAVGFQIKVQYLAQKDLRRMVKNGEVALYTTTFAAHSTELEDFFREQIDSRWQKTIANPLWDQLLDNAGQQDQTMRLNLYRQLEREVLGDARIRYLYAYQSALGVSEQLDNVELGLGNNVLFEEIRLKE